MCTTVLHSAAQPPKFAVVVKQHACMAVGVCSNACMRVGGAVGPHSACMFSTSFFSHVWLILWCCSTTTPGSWQVVSCKHLVRYICACKA
jgi:hypothetical protein